MLTTLKTLWRVPRLRGGNQTRLVWQLLAALLTHIPQAAATRALNILHDVVTLFFATKSRMSWPRAAHCYVFPAHGIVLTRALAEPL